MTARPRKVEIIVLGRGLAAAALAALLVARGRAVALLVEEPGWETGQRRDAPGEHQGEHIVLAERGALLLAEWQAAGVPGLSREGAHWLLDYDRLLPALGEQIAAGERSSVALGTHVRGISVIEGAILGAIAEDARYDARIVVNAAQDERHAAFGRMMREPHPLDPHAYFAGMTEVKGAWRISGVAGWPLLGLAAAAHLAEQLTAPSEEKP
jgi:hypothetical protein